MNLFLAIVPLVFVINGCASGGGTIPEGAAPLSTEEIAETFSGVQESYRGRDNPAVSAKGTFREGGTSVNDDGSVHGIHTLQPLE